MSEVRIGGNSDDISVDLFELAEFVTEGYELGGADVGEIERIEDDSEVLAGVIVQRNFAELSMKDGLGLEEGGLLSGKAAEGGGSVSVYT
eukprot:CAMPEP_0114592338 /NCGR_PEP_ID=MMETSP0125-20121206/14188_1 /TAXON_ID=485358 ORGANISM="Aristerostoma sp., Strain ATCC 50986" /NCGR_SAMPLE_ID=MMETSP0125 /ASSEMBLY_ACC=CAM_ASM_000245 /LENGTH=89 /DNA_ID=CAMNT_0001790929 /DNA_START=400 /DNA_END=665 /DNA_ORIENTATION=-